MPGTDTRVPRLLTVFPPKADAEDPGSIEMQHSVKTSNRYNAYLYMRKNFRPLIKETNRVLHTVRLSQPSIKHLIAPQSRLLPPGNLRWPRVRRLFASEVDGGRTCAASSAS